MKQRRLKECEEARKVFGPVTALEEVGTCLDTRRGCSDDGADSFSTLWFQRSKQKVKASSERVMVPSAFSCRLVDHSCARVVSIRDLA